MTTATETLSGKARGDKNFPVASWLLSEERRAPILAYYRFARAAETSPTIPNLPPDEKLRSLIISTARCVDAAFRPGSRPLRIQLEPARP